MCRIVLSYLLCQVDIIHTHSHITCRSGLATHTRTHAYVFDASSKCYLLGRLWVVGILVRVQLEGHLAVGLLDLVGGRRLGQTQQLVQRIARRAASRTRVCW